MDWEGRRVTVVGLGREGAAVARYLAARGAHVIVTDRKPAEELIPFVQTLQRWPVEYALGGHPEWVLNSEMLFVSPGIPPDIPLLARAREMGISLSSETELFFSLCPAPIIGITGSSGKTTTTSLVGEIFRKAGERTWVGGNIGEPLLNVVDDIAPTDRVVMELSSFQLEHLDMSPHIAAVLNITPNHLDRHRSMEAYAAAKRHIVAYQHEDDVAVFGRDDDMAYQMGLETAAHRPHRVAWFSAAEPVSWGAYGHAGELIFADGAHAHRVGYVHDIRLRGAHNVLNTLAAIAIAGVGGAPVEAMFETIGTFEGVPHRLEEVRTWRDVVFVNDSIATSPERSMAALRSFAEPIVLLAGGRDKDLFWGDWAELVLQRVRKVVLFGEAAGLIREALMEAFSNAASAGISTLLTPADVHEAVTLEKAVQTAVEVARPGDVVLLSPGGTSYDAYLDFAERGEHFRRLVRML